LPSPDTIAAIATPAGTGALGIIRVSGPDAIQIALRIFRPRKKNFSLESHHLYYGDIITGDGKTVLDEVLISIMSGPHSFTGEDVLEINCHGNPLIMQNILSYLLQSGCRPAEPGEFSRRAFLHGRIDLSQAEALATLISSQSEKARDIGLAQLKGNLGAEIEKLRIVLVEALANTEASIDFAEDIEEPDVEDIYPQLDNILKRLKIILDTYETAKLYTHGVNVVIAGKPNVGKSSLLNMLTGKTRAIVTDIPGTTRDFIESQITIQGIPVNIVDTAGIRIPEDIIEEAGIDLVWKNLACADLALILLDGSKPLTREDTDVFSGISSKKHLIVINKTDLPAAWNTNDLDHLLPGSNILCISSKIGTGIEALKEALIARTVHDQVENTGTVMIVNLRHKIALEKAYINIERAKENISRNVSMELTAFDLHEALDNLDEITGIKINDKILENIFSSFCIGK
jgi:tRNA modification GTPase